MAPRMNKYFMLSWWARTTDKINNSISKHFRTFKWRSVFMKWGLSTIINSPCQRQCELLSSPVNQSNTTKQTKTKQTPAVHSKCQKIYAGQ
jgi:hypothetical protein